MEKRGYDEFKEETENICNRYCDCDYCYGDYFCCSFYAVGKGSRWQQEEEAGSEYEEKNRNCAADPCPFGGGRRHILLELLYKVCEYCHNLSRGDHTGNGRRRIDERGSREKGCCLCG